MENWSNGDPLPPPVPTSPRSNRSIFLMTLPNLLYLFSLVASARSWTWERLLSSLVPWQMKVNISSMNQVMCVTQASTCWRKFKNIRNVTNAARSTNNPKDRHDASQQRKKLKTPKKWTWTRPYLEINTRNPKDIGSKFWILIFAWSKNQGYFFSKAKRLCDAAGKRKAKNYKLDFSN